MCLDLRYSLTAAEPNFDPFATVSVKTTCQIAELYNHYRVVHLHPRERERESTQFISATSVVPFTELSTLNRGIKGTEKLKGPKN